MIELHKILYESVSRYIIIDIWMLFIIAELRKEKKMNNNVKVSESKSLAIDDKNNPEVRMSMSVQIKSYG